MKKIMISMAIVTTIVMTGCASDYSPWKSMPYQEAHGWQGIGVTAYHAQQFRRKGFTPMDIKPWIQVGIKSPVIIINWHQAGFTPRSTSKWLAKGFTLQKAIDLKKRGLTVQ